MFSVGRTETVNVGENVRGENMQSGKVIDGRLKC